MQRPEVRIVAVQSTEDSPIDVNQSEADALLAKYGYKSTYISNNTTPTKSTDTRTFDEMVRQQEEQLKIDNQRRNRPRAITFDDSRTNFSETRWTSMEDETGNQFGMQITVVTDMKI
jgi:hypothetical protein